jgi:hypothetical protein
VSDLDRFMAKVDRSSECWLWTAALFSNGYGAFRVGPKQVRAHRWAYAHFVGPIPEGAVVMHRCDVRRCANPDHLTTGSQAENQADMTAKGRGRTGWRNGGRLNAPKLTLASANEIRERYAAGGVRQADLAAEYGVDQKMVSMIVRNLRWVNQAAGERNTAKG